MTMGRKRSDEAAASSIQSVERALDILFLLAEAKTALTVSEIAERLNVHVSTASRLLSTLAQQNVVAQSRDGYRLGLGLLRLTHVVLNELTIRTVAMPHLRRLSQLTTRSIYLAALSDGDELYLDQVDAENRPSTISWIGRSIPAHTASGGKVLLAYLDDDQLNAHLANGLSANTQHTITDPDVLRAQLEQVRERGYAISQDEFMIGFSAVAAPIFDRTRQNVAAIAVSVPTSETTPEQLHQLAPLVIATANTISMELGYTANGKGKFPHDARPKGSYRLTHH